MHASDHRRSVWERLHTFLRGARSFTEEEEEEENNMMTKIRISYSFPGAQLGFRI